MRFRVSSLTSVYPLRARETVPIETPLRRANCRIVTLSSLISENGFGTVSRSLFIGAGCLSRGLAHFRVRHCGFHTNRRDRAGGWRETHVHFVATIGSVAASATKRTPA